MEGIQAEGRGLTQRRNESIAFALQQDYRTAPVRME